MSPVISRWVVRTVIGVVIVFAVFWLLKLDLHVAPGIFDFHSRLF